MKQNKKGKQQKQNLPKSALKALTLNIRDAVNSVHSSHKKVFKTNKF